MINQIAIVVTPRYRHRSIGTPPLTPHAIMINDQSVLHDVLIEVKHGQELFLANV
jgi:hypothetical protein